MTNEHNKEINIENISPENILKLYEQNEKRKQKQKEYQQTHKDLVNKNIRKHYDKMKNEDNINEIFIREIKIN